MRKILLLGGMALWAMTACSDKHEEEITPDIWDIDSQGIPEFVSTNYIELDKIYRISKFRSSVGHDYSDAFESCRSMKHYFEPKPEVNWASITIHSPIGGEITRVEEEWAGTKLEIQSEQYLAFRFQIFHIKTTRTFTVGEHVSEGDLLGTHIGPETMSDISVIVNDPTRQGRMVSWFETITDDLFTQYIQRGATSRDDFIISKELRDANPIDCNNFGANDPLENWVVLN